MSAESDQPELRWFEAGTVRLRSGAELRDARVGYTVHGSLNAAGDNAVLFPTFYGGTHVENTFLIGPDRVLDPSRYCVVVPNMFANGISTSPSTYDGEFPLVTIHDNVTVQHELVTRELGISQLALVIGFSMGGQQAYEWASRFPAMVRRLAVLASAARTAPHSWVFLEGVKAALCTGGSLEPGTDSAEAGKRAMGRVWAGWGLSQAWYRQRRWESGGFASLEIYLQEEWEAGFGEADARDLLAMIETWQAHDIGGVGAGEAEYAAALGAISADCLIMPSSTDLYFPPEDSAEEVRRLARGRLAVIQSVFGHAAGAGADPADLAVIEAEVRALLDR